MKTAAMPASEFNPFADEARYFCHERGIDDPETTRAIEFDLRHKAFQWDIQPIIKLMVGIESCAMPTHLVHPDGRIERVGDGLGEAARESLLLCKKLIAETAARYGLKFGDEVPDAMVPLHPPG